MLGDINPALVVVQDLNPVVYAGRDNMFFCYGIGWVVELQGARLVVVDQPAEATVRGTATDLLLLAGRREDADTLFFQRRLVLTGDTELGLVVKNMLDAVEWPKFPIFAAIRQC